jgi:hypothetical protein
MTIRRPTGTFLVRRNNFYIRTARPRINEKFYRGDFVSRVVRTDASILFQSPRPGTLWSEINIEVWEPVGEPTEEIFDAAKCAEVFPDTLTTF